MTDASLAEAVMQPAHQYASPFAFMQAIGDDVPLGRIHIVYGNECGFTPHRQADITLIQ